MVLSEVRQLQQITLTSVTQELDNAMESISHSHKIQVFGFRRLNVVLPQIAGQLFCLSLRLFVI